MAQILTSGDPCSQEGSRLHQSLISSNRKATYITPKTLYHSTKTDPTVVFLNPPSATRARKSLCMLSAHPAPDRPPVHPRRASRWLSETLDYQRTSEVVRFSAAPRRSTPEGNIILAHLSPPRLSRPARHPGLGTSCLQEEGRLRQPPVSRWHKKPCVTLAQTPTGGDPGPPCSQKKGRLCQSPVSRNGKTADATPQNAPP